jgi:hypothetical protein
MTVLKWQGLSPNQARRDAAPQFPSHEYQTPAIFQLFHTKRWCLRHTTGAQDERLLNNRILMRFQATVSTP